MLVQAGALGLLVAGDGAFAPSLAAAVLLGAGTAMVYPTLIAAVSDAIQPRDRARVVGVYRFWRDFGFVLGALIAGIGADAASPRPRSRSSPSLTAASGLARRGQHLAAPSRSPPCGRTQPAEVDPLDRGALESLGRQEPARLPAPCGEGADRDQRREHEDDQRRRREAW